MNDALKENEDFRKEMEEENAQFEIARSDKEIKNGRTIIFAISALFVLSAIIEYFQLGQEPVVFAIYAPLIIIYIVFGALYYRHPLGFSIAALSLYGLLIVLMAALEPLSLAKGIIVKGIIIVGLIRAIRSAKDFQSRRKKVVEDLLDQGF